MAKLLKVMTFVWITVSLLVACAAEEEPPQALNPVAVITDTVVESPAETVFANGKVYTVNQSQPWAEAIAVRGNEIVYVGDNAGVEATEVAEVGVVATMMDGKFTHREGL
jgi:hypothetical protein